MIGRTNRFHGHNSLRYVYTHGQVVRGPMLSLKYCLNPKRSTYRLAVVVSKKVVKSAVGRNRLRRRIYEQVRLLKQEIAEPYDLVITVYNDQLADLPTPELTTMVRAQFHQAHIITSKKPQ
jgi:ribonuclease P protein component